MAIEGFSNKAATQVTSGGTDAPASGTQQVWTVANSADFPSATTAAPPLYFLVVDSAFPAEIIKVINVSGTSWTVLRGAEGTSPGPHAAMFEVRQIVSAAWFDKIEAYVADVMSYGATGDGVTDDVSAFNAAYDALPSSGGVIKVPAGSYYLAASPTIWSKPIMLEGEGDASHITLNSAVAAGIGITSPHCGLRDVKITNCRVNVNDNDDHFLAERVYAVAGYADGSFKIYNANHAIIRDCRFDAATGTDIHVLGSSSYCIIEDNRVITQNAGAIANSISFGQVTTGRGNIIRGNILLDVSSFAIEVWGFKDTLIQNNYIRESGSTSGGISIVLDCTGSIVSGNYIDTDGPYGLEVGSSNMKVVDNYFAGAPSSNGIIMNGGSAGITNLDISGNHVATSSTIGAAIQATGSGSVYVSNSSITNNTVTDGHLYGLQLGGCERLRIEGNHVRFTTGSVAKTAIALGQQIKSIISGNTVYINTHANSVGIEINGTAGTKCIITNNLIDGGGVCNYDLTTSATSPTSFIFEGNSLLGAASRAFSISSGATGWKIGNNVVDQLVDVPATYALVGSDGIGATAGQNARQILVGSGTPEGTVTAQVGCLYIRTDGGAGTSLYVKESGGGNTGWVGK